jgi:hypothetical protein
MKLSPVRIERWLWYLFLATASLQTRLILWQADSIFSEWRAASLFFSDICIVALICCAALTYRRQQRWKLTLSDGFLGLLFAAAVLSLSNAEQLTVGVYGLVKLAEFMAFYFYLRYRAWGRFDADKSAIAFVAGAVGQATLGIVQYVFQHDIGLRWLGEALLRTDMRGVAVFYGISHEKILRAYGTLPHPNVLAAYLVVALWLIVWLWLRHHESSWRRNIVWGAAMGILLVGLYLTFSRTVIAVWAVSWLVIVFVIYSNRSSDTWPNIALIRRRFRFVLMTAAAVTIAFAVLLWPNIVARLTIAVSDEAVRQRVQYNNDALATGTGWALHVNWTGVGLGNFTSWLARFDRALPAFVTQPAHNIFLLVYSETGAIGVGVWVLWLGTVLLAVKTAHRSEPLVRIALLTLVATFLLIGSMDHFFWTLQQGRILWWGALALAAGKPGR